MAQILSFLRCPFEYLFVTIQMSRHYKFKAEMTPAILKFVVGLQALKVHLSPFLPLRRL